METQISVVGELQDFFRRRAEVELDYSKNLDKLSKSLSARHKEQKQKYEQQLFLPIFLSFKRKKKHMGIWPAAIRTPALSLVYSISSQKRKKKKKKIRQTFGLSAASRVDWKVYLECFSEAPPLLQFLSAPV